MTSRKRIGWNIWFEENTFPQDDNRFRRAIRCGPSVSAFDDPPSISQGVETFNCVKTLLVSKCIHVVRRNFSRATDHRGASIVIPTEHTLRGSRLVILSTISTRSVTSPRTCRWFSATIQAAASRGGEDLTVSVMDFALSGFISRVRRLPGKRARCRRRPRLSENSPCRPHRWSPRAVSNELSLDFPWWWRTKVLKCCCCPPTAVPTWSTDHHVINPGHWRI